MPDDELREAYERHVRCRADGDWSALADCFAEDARYFDPIFGWHTGREAIRGFLKRAMAGLADRDFRDVWHVIDGNRLVLYWQCDAREGAFESGDPDLYHGTSALLYAGDGRWQEQVDIYDREQARSSRTRAGSD